MSAGHEHIHTPASFNRAFAIGIGLNLAFVAVEAWGEALAGTSLPGSPARDESGA